MAHLCGLFYFVTKYVTGVFLMASNGISTLPTKAARKVAKIALAASKRSAVGTNGYRSNHTYDATAKSPTTPRPWK